MEESRARVLRGVDIVKRVLRDEQTVRFQHLSFENSFGLAEHVVRHACQCVLDILLPVDGINVDDRQCLLFKLHETCSHDRDETVEKEKITLKEGTLVSHSLVTSETLSHWIVEVVCQMSQGQPKKLFLPVVTAQSSLAPRASSLHQVDPCEATLPWLKSNADFFAIRTSSSSTPRRNEQSNEAYKMFSSLSQWAKKVGELLDVFFQDPFSQRMSWSPTWEQQGAEKEDEVFFPSSQQGWDDMRHALMHSVHEALSWTNNSLLEEMLVRMNAVHNVCVEAMRDLDYLEAFLRRKLISCLGKEVGVDDFSCLLHYHLKQHPQEEYRPKAMSFALRRNYRSGDGYLDADAFMSLEDDGDNALWESFQRNMEGRMPLVFSLDASSPVQMSARVSVHGHMRHSFAGEECGSGSKLVVRARPFGCVAVLLGRMLPGGRVQVEYASLVDSTTLSVALQLETIPTQKEFKKAVDSLSLEQRRFAEMFRSMQLSSTLFTVCVVHVKPQMEKLLKVPEATMTRDFVLCRNVLEMFTKYNINPDLLSATRHGTVEELRGNMNAIERIIQRLKDEAMKDKALTATKTSVVLMEMPKQLYPTYCIFPKQHPRGDVITNQLDSKRKFKLPSRERKLTPVDEMLKKEQKRLAQIVRLGIFGPPGSGKTTLLKQARRHFTEGFDDEEMEEFKFICQDNAQYKISPYFEACADEILREDFRPNDKDILFCRAISQGCPVVEYQHDGAVFEMSEICQTNVKYQMLPEFTAIVFVVDMSDFESMLENRDMFSGIVNSPHFNYCTKFLFLNKKDLFLQKVSDLKYVFPDYAGKTENDAMDFVAHKFRKLMKQPGQTIYTHVVVLSDDNQKPFFDALKETLLRKSMCSAGLGVFDDISPKPKKTMASEGSTSSTKSTSRPPRMTEGAGGRERREGPSHHHHHLVDEERVVHAPTMTAEERVEDSQASSPSITSTPLLSSSAFDDLGQELNTRLDACGSNMMQTIVRIDPNVNISSDKTKQCFDVLHAISKGGALLVDDVQCHIVVVGTQRYAHSLIDTLVVDNVDPLHQIMKSCTTLADVILGKEEAIEEDDIIDL